MSAIFLLLGERCLRALESGLAPLLQFSDQDPQRSGSCDQQVHYGLGEGAICGRMFSSISLRAVRSKPVLAILQDLSDLVFAKASNIRQFPLQSFRQRLRLVQALPEMLGGATH